MGDCFQICEADLNKPLTTIDQAALQLGTFASSRRRGKFGFKASFCRDLYEWRLFDTNPTPIAGEKLGKRARFGHSPHRTMCQNSTVSVTGGIDRFWQTLFLKAAVGAPAAKVGKVRIAAIYNASMRA